MPDRPWIISLPMKAPPIPMLCLAALAAGCTRLPVTDEEIIRDIVVNVAQAAENKDIQGIKRFISPGYRDTEGNDYQALNGFLLAQFLRGEKIGITLAGTRVSVPAAVPPGGPGQGGRANSHTEALLTRVPAGGGTVVPARREASYYRFDLSWEKVDGAWKVTAASWGPLDRLP